MRHPQNLFLVGPMGAGKSAVGRQLARALHLEFVDSDEILGSLRDIGVDFAQGYAIGVPQPISKLLA